MSRLSSSLFVLLLAAWWALPTALSAAETVCVECHAGQPDALGAPVEAWRTSVHAENGISCHDCHGGDPTDYDMAMSPERGFIGVPEYREVPDFCARCHVGVAEEYRAGAHGQAIEEGGAQCVVCHGNHAVARAGLDLINEEDCSRCHGYERAALIRLSLVETDNMIGGVDRDLDRLYRLGFNVDDMRAGLFNQRNRFHRIFHGVDVERVRRQSADVQGELGKISSQVAALDATLGERKLWGSLVIGLFVLCGVVLLLVRKTYQEDEQG